MAKCQTYFGVIMVLLVVFLVSMATPQPVVEETSDGDQINRWMHSKRPFCNAFAGCGRKRASTSSEDQSISDFEKAMNNFPRLLNAESKLWDRLYAKLQQRYNKKQYDYAN